MPKKAGILLSIVFFIVLLAGTSLKAAAAPASAPLLQASDVIAEINAYRQANGFSALPVNNLLASLAKTQSEYQASINEVTHTGPGGTRPKERAAAAGYAGGGTFFMSEIIYGGTNATAASAIHWWKNSALHNSVLLDARYAEMGAGVAYDGNKVYFTVELAWTGNYIEYSGVGGDSAGNVGTLPGGSGAGSGSGTGSGSGSGSDSSPAATSAPVVIPVALATPQEDGSIVHIVQSGQTLWTIAAIYGVDLQTLYDLNQLNSSSFIYSGQEIIVRPPTVQASATSTAPPTPTETPIPTATSTPRQPVIGEAFSYAPQDTLPPAEITTATQPVPPLAAVQAETKDKTAQWLIIASIGIIFAAAITSTLMTRKNR